MNLAFNKQAEQNDFNDKLTDQKNANNKTSFVGI